MGSGRAESGASRRRRPEDSFDSFQMPQTPVEFLEARKEATLESMVDRDSVASGIADVLAMATAAVPPGLGPRITVFDADPLQPPVISMEAYMRHWLAHSECSVDCAALALAYVLRCRVAVNSLNIHRLMLGALVVAIKWRDDLYFSNEFYAGVGGVSVQELNRLETEILRMCDWSMHVDSDDHCKIASALSGDDKSTEDLSEMLRDGSASPGGSLFGDSSTSSMEHTLVSSTLTSNTATSMTPPARGSHDPFQVDDAEDTTTTRGNICTRIMSLFCPRRKYESTATSETL
eukprot:Hpha_TRINITY_DN15873_c1_g1::TRINITY_DN15873_c1_g1_i1::g.189766::m.189766